MLLSGKVLPFQEKVVEYIAAAFTKGAPFRKDGRVYSRGAAFRKSAAFQERWSSI